MNESIFEKVKEIASISQVVECFGNLKLNRSSMACCPFHQEKNPSFSVKESDGIFKCFACGVSGDSIDFVAKLKDIEPIDAAKEIANYYGIADTLSKDNKQVVHKGTRAPNTTQKPNKATKQAIKVYLEQCIKDVDKTDYFQKRGLTKDTIGKFCLGYDTNKKCVVIPYSSKLEYYQTRSIDGKEFRKPPSDEAGAEPIWNSNALTLKETVFVVESPICAMSIMQCGGQAISLCGTGINKLLGELKAKKTKCSLVLSFDNDEPGERAQQELARELFELNIRYIIYNTAGGCKDPNELLTKSPKQLELNIKSAQLALRKKYITDKDSFDACELVNEKLEPVDWIVENLLPTGLSMLCAPSKYGKSWMVLQLCVAVSEGKPFLNFKTFENGCLYYALEDSKNRLQDRLTKMLKGKPASRNMHFAIKADTLDGGLLNKIEDEMRVFPNIKLVIIDTLQKVREKMSKDDTLYGNEYRQMAAIKEFADKHKICVLFVHHLRKMADESDVFNMISGSTALMGASDTILILSRKKRNDEQSTLSSTGRDIQQAELVVAFDKSNYKWEVEGTAEEISERREREEYETNIYIQTIKELVKRNPISGWSGSAQDLMKAVYDVTGKTVADNESSVGRQIQKYSTKLYYDDIVHKATRTSSARKHNFSKRTPLSPYFQGTIYDSND